MIAPHQAATAESRTLSEIVSPPSNTGLLRFSIIVCLVRPSIFRSLAHGPRSGDSLLSDDAARRYFSSRWRSENY